MRYTHIVWDFNGTIVNDVEAGIKSENVLLARRGMPLLEDVEYYRSIFTFPIVDYYKKLGHDFERDPYEKLSVEWTEQYQLFSKDAPLNEGVTELLDWLHAQGCKQIVLSASELGLLREQLRHLGVLDRFDEVLGLDNVEAYSKLKLAEDWLRREKPGRTLVIGDTQHDAETAEALGADCLLLTLGHQSRRTLERFGVPVLDSFAQVRAWLEAESADA